MPKKWFHTHAPDTGWDKDQKPRYRRKLMLRAHKGDPLKAARAMNGLANVTQDRQTQIAARRDAKYFFAQNKRETRFID